MFSSETDMSRSRFLQPNPSNQNITNQVSEFSKSREFNGSDFFQTSNQHQESVGLARYRSAPSSFLAALLESTTATDNSSCSGDESEALFSAFMDEPPRDLIDQKNDNHQMQFSMKQEIGAETEPRPGQNGLEYSEGPDAILGSYSVSGFHTKRLNHGNGSNLLRQSSSPAGFFNGYGVVGEVGNYRVLDNHAEANSSSNNMSNQINFSSAPSSSMSFMPSITGYGNESINTCNPGNSPMRNNNGGNSSWSETPFNSLKRNREDDLKMFSDFNGFENQSGESGKNTHGLVHHLSLPKTSAEMAVVENYLHFQQETTGVPCQIRAKRGFATHPRSIAERMRRTRISEKMKKLQDLFPNMDKQTNTAEMLDTVVEYIKDLQKQVQTLNETKAKCVCSNKPQQTTPTT